MKEDNAESIKRLAFQTANFVSDLTTDHNVAVAALKAISDTLKKGGGLNSQLNDIESVINHWNKRQEESK